jgi:hypothetical protein
MATPTNKELQQLYDKLTRQISDLNKMCNGKHIRGGVSACTEKIVSGVPKRTDTFLAFFIDEDIPFEFVDFLTRYRSRLIEQRQQVLSLIENTIN